MQAYEGYIERGMIFPSKLLDGIQERRRVIITVLDEPDKPKKLPVATARGIWSGKVWMADDFDAPLEEFAEYM